jgi:hypothetical protein
MAGNQGFALSSTSGLSGFGGTSKYGSGGLPAGSNGTGIINGNPASGGGAGGGGAVASNSALQATGGNGSNGVLIVYEYS